MPNWCSNKIIIFGNKMQMEKIYGYLTYNDVISLESLFPIPKSTKKEEKKKEWMLENWGVETSLNGLEKIEESVLDSETIMINVKTPFHPLIKFCGNVSKKFKVDVYIYYYEPTDGYCGTTRFKNGESLSNIYHTYINDFKSFNKFRITEGFEDTVFLIKRRLENTIHTFKECMFFTLEKSIQDLNALEKDRTSRRISQSDLNDMISTIEKITDEVYFEELYESEFVHRFYETYFVRYQNSWVFRQALTEELNRISNIKKNLVKKR